MRRYNIISRGEIIRNEFVFLAFSCDAIIGKKAQLIDDELWRYDIAELKQQRQKGFVVGALPGQTGGAFLMP